MKLKAYEELEDSIRRKVKDFEQQKGLVFTMETVRRYVLDPLTELNRAERHRRNKYYINKNAREQNS